MFILYGSLPHSVELEREVLGSVLVSPDGVVVLEEMGVEPSDFYLECHSHFCRAMLSLRSKSIPVDPMTLEGELRSLGIWDRSGGFVTMGNVMDKTGLSSHLVHYCSSLRSISLKRSVVIAGVDSAEEARKLDGESALESSMTRWRDLSLSRGSSGGLEARDGIRQYLKRMKQIQDGELVDSRIQTGIGLLDERLGGGIRPGWQVVVMSSSGHGKTSFAVNNLAINAARLGHPVLICSLEMKPDEIYARLIAAECGVPVHVHEQPGMSSYDVAEVVNAGTNIARLPITVIDSSKGSASEIRSVAESIKNRHGSIGMVVVDYIQLMKSGSGKKDSTTEEDISSNSKALKHMAVELDCVSVVLSQPVLSAKRERRRPTIQQAKGSGSIEDDCDLALVPWQPRLVDDKEPTNCAEIGMDKFRHGPPHSLTREDVRWSGRRMRFEGI